MCVLASILFAALAAEVPAASGQVAGDPDPLLKPVEEKAPLEGDPAPESSDTRPVFEDSIIVTAQKREQNLQDVPVAVSLLTSDEIADRRFREVVDIIDFVPNADVKDALPGFSQIITIRGVGQNDFGFLNTPSVGVYLDEVHLASPGQFGFTAFDLERVEVLRGPQGTLYGRNTTGGAINLHTVKPSSRKDGYLTVGVGSFESAEFEGAVGGPLGAGWSGRLAGRFERQGESFHFNRLANDDFGSSESAAVRGQLATSRGGFGFNLSLSYANTDGAHVPYEQKGLLDRASVEAILADPEQGLPIYAALNAPWCDATAAGGFDQQNCVNVHGYSDTDNDPWSHDAHTTGGYLDFEQYDATATLSWALGRDVELRSITGYQHFDNRRTEDQSGPLILFAPRIHGWIEQFSQELRLNGDTEKLFWVGGLFYSYDSAHERAEDAMDDFFSTRLFSHDDQKTTSYAGFANIDWALNDTWALTAGARLTHEKREKFAESTDLNPFQSSLFLALFQDLDPTTSGAVTYASTDDEITHTDMSGRLALEYRPVDRWLLYLSAGSSFKSGGWITGIVFDQNELEPFEPEEITAYEFGFKGDIGTGLLLNGAVFYYDYENIQTYIQSSIGFRLGNVDGARSLGGEVELIARPTRRLAIRAGVGYLDTELSEFRGADGLVPEGNDLPNAPELDLNGFIRYDLPLTARLSLALQTDFTYQSEMFRTADNDPLTTTDGRFVVNGRVALGPPNGKWEIALWGRNLGNEDIVLSGFNTPILGLVTQVFGAPRTYGLSLGWNI